MKNIQRAVHDFGVSHGIPDLLLDEMGSCTLMLEDGHTLHLQYTKQHTLMLLSSLGSVPADAEAPVYSALLYANLFWAETMGATLALEPQTMEVVLQFEEKDNNIDSLRLEQLIINFADATEVWKERLAQLNTAATEKNVTTDIPFKPMPNVPTWAKA